MTAVWHDWLEVFGFDPDHRSGTAECAIVAALFVVSLTCAIAARIEWGRTAVAQ